MNASRTQDVFRNDTTAYMVNVSAPLGPSSACNRPVLNASATSSSDGSANLQTILSGSRGEDKALSYGITTSNNRPGNGDKPLPFGAGVYDEKGKEVVAVGQGGQIFARLVGEQDAMRISSQIAIDIRTTAVSGPYPLDPNFATFRNQGGTTIIGTICFTITPSINVHLPAVKSAQLPNIGATTGTTPFAIVLNCPQPPTLFMTLTDASNSGNTSATLGISSSSTARGIALQVLHGDQRISFGPD